VGGKNVGKHGKIVEIEESKGQKRRDLLVTIEDKNGGRFQTTVNFVFAVGETSPSISLPEVK
jgi:small subunit ribosomal protein S4e